MFVVAYADVPVTTTSAANRLFLGGNKVLVPLTYPCMYNEYGTSTYQYPG